MKRTSFTAALSTIVMTCAALAQSPGQSDQHTLPFIRVAGNHFVDENGKVFIFRGVSFSDPDRLERMGHWNKAYFEVARNWNANVVRFPVHPRAWRERGEEEYLKLLDQGIQWAAELRLYVIIDWHSIGNLRTELFQHPMYNTTKTETLRFWKTIAQRYARGAHIPVIGDESYGEAIIGYFNKKGISWTAWVFDPVWSPQLIENWDFEPSQQGGFFKAKLEQLNQHVEK